MLAKIPTRCLGPAIFAEAPSQAVPKPLASSRGERLSLAAMRSFLPALALTLVAAGAASAQTGFRVIHDPIRTKPDYVEVKGVVFNESRADAVDVSVTVEALDDSGKALARGISYVARRIPERDSASFVAKVPAVPGVSSYRVFVSSFRFVQGFQQGP